MKKRIICIACLLLLALPITGMGAEETSKDGNGGSFLHDNAQGLDPAVRPFGVLLADNAVFIFNLVGGAAILLSGAIGTAQKRKGKLNQAAESKHLSWDITKGLLLTVFLFDMFIIVSNNAQFGL